MNELFNTFQEFRKILCICPCCGDLVRVSDLKLKTKGTTFKTWLDQYEAKRQILDKKEEKFGEIESKIREVAVAKGRKAAEIACNKLVCPGLKVFKIDPFDIKPILSPVDFVAFKGMNKEENISNIVFLTRKSEDVCEGLCTLRKQVEKAVTQKKYDWQVARIDEDGKIEVEQ